MLNISYGIYYSITENAKVIEMENEKKNLLEFQLTW
jgi:hypothetical protein